MRYRDYYACPYCGACLDPGERCECQDEPKHERQQEGRNENRHSTRPFGGKHTEVSFKDYMHVYAERRASSF